MRSAAAGAALFEEDDAIRVGIEKAAIIGNETRAWSTVEKHDGFAVRRAALFVIKFVNSGHSNVAAVVRFDLVVKSSQCLHVAGDYRVRRAGVQRLRGEIGFPGDFNREPVNFF